MGEGRSSEIREMTHRAEEVEGAGGGGGEKDFRARKKT